MKFVKKNKKRISLIFLLMFFIPIIGIYESSANGIDLPIIDILDLKVDGSGNGGVNVSIIQIFTVITRVIVHLEFTDTSMEINNFGSGNALTNGTRAFIQLDGLIRDLTSQQVLASNDDFGQYSYDMEWISDEKSPKDWLILARLSFFKLAPLGFDNRTEMLGNFWFQVNDDLNNGDTNEYTIAVQGYRRIFITYFINDHDIFYNGAINFVELEELRINNEYALKFTNNNSVIKWNNFTAINDIMVLEIFIDLRNLEAGSVLEVELYKNDVLLDSSSRVLKASNIDLPQGFIDTLILMLQYFAIFVLGMILFGMFTRSGKKW